MFIAPLMYGGMLLSNNSYKDNKQAYRNMEAKKVQQQINGSKTCGSIKQILQWTHLPSQLELEFDSQHHLCPLSNTRSDPCI